MENVTGNGSSPLNAGVVTPNHMVPDAQVVGPNMAMIPHCHAEKPEKFNGLNFKRWQQKMFFDLTKLNLARFLTENAPQVNVGEGDVQALSAIDAWKHSDFYVATMC